MSDEPNRVGSAITSLAYRPKLADEITRSLREAIMLGEFRPGDRLVIKDLSARFGVSSMPVREAVLLLASEGMLDSIARRGFRVAQLRRKDFEDIFNVHAYLAGQLAAAAAAQVTDSQLDELKGIQQMIADASVGPPIGSKAVAEGVAQLNFDFHRKLNHISDASRLRWFLRAATRYVPQRYYEEVPGWVEATVAEHPALIEALARRDPDEAREQAIAHVSHAGELVIRHLAQRGFWHD